ncbi:MAG: hypothetical protein JW969_19935 [Spirochaetales bacterium]|nr:hypothetical protein [Spirochaetales bacterium]
MVTSRYEKNILRKPAIRSKSGKLEFPVKIDTRGLVDTGPLVWQTSEGEDADVFVEHGIISGDLVVGGGAAIGPSGFIEKPHKHDTHGETFLFIGTNPDDPTDLGAEAEFCLGEGDRMEKVIINTTSKVYVPPGVAHFPLTWRNVKRPCIFVVLRGSATKGAPGTTVSEKGRTK